MKKITEVSMEMKKSIFKTLLVVGILSLSAGSQIEAGDFSVGKIFHKKTAPVQSADTEIKAADNTSDATADSEAEADVPVVYPAVINTQNEQKTSFKNKIKSRFHKDQNTNIDLTESESCYETAEETAQSGQTKKRGLFRKNKLSEEQAYEKEHKLTKIENIIESSDYLNHDTENDIYLDKYKRKELSTLKDFYKEKDIVENSDGSYSMVIKGDNRAVDKLIDEIENTNPNETFTPAVQLSLKDCIGIAIAKHPDILSAKLSTDVYKDRIVQAWAAYFPNLSAGIGYNRYHNKIDHYSHGYNSHYIPNVSAGLMLFDFGKTKTNVDIAKTDYEASKFELESSINEVVYAVKIAYYNLLFAQKQIEVYRNTIEDFEFQLKVAKKYFEIGKKPQIDVTTAEYNLGNAKLNLVKAINTLEVARVSLANTMGLPAFANFELSDSLPTYEYNTDLETLLQDAFSIRPDLLRQEKAVEAAYLAIRSAKRNYTPDLMANGTYSRGKTDKTDESNFQVGLDLTYSGLNLMQIKKEHDIAKKAYEKALVDYESAKHNVYLDVKQSYINLSNTKNTVKQAELNVAQAKEQNYHATGRYNAGYGDAMELKDAENTYLNSQLEYYQALLEYNTEAANIERLVGRPLVSTETKL